MMVTRRRYQPLLALLIILSSPVVNAALIATENFDYADGALAGNSGGSGFSNAWSGTGQVSGGVGTFSSGDFDNAFRNLAGALAPVAGDSLFIAFDFAVSATQANTYAGVTLFETGGGPEVTFAGLSFPFGPLGVGSNGFAVTDPSASLPTVFPVFNLLVHEVVFGAGGIFTANLYIDPMGALGAPDDTTTGTYSPGVAIDLFRPGAGVFSGSPGMIAYIDNLRIGTALSDVHSVPVSGTLALLGLGFIGMAARRRKTA